VASLRPVFAPESVVVIGASRNPGTVGRSVLENIRTGGFAGRLYAVNPNQLSPGETTPRTPRGGPDGSAIVSGAQISPGGTTPRTPRGAPDGSAIVSGAQIGGIPCFPDVASLPEAPDLALLAVPPAAVADTAEACGRRGVRGLVVFTAAVDAPAGAELLDICRRHGMRLIGPNCFGIAVPSIGLDATFAAANPLPGTVGIVMQSGGLGFAMVDHLTRLGIGISSFASVGNKLDVSSNDLLMWWEQDGLTRLAVLYIESFGNPRKFGRTARRVGLKMPVLTVHAGRSEAGQRAAASHTAAVATPLVTREALFEQAGIIATPSFGELMGATALLSTQPPPAGRTVAIVSNVGGAGVLAADACTDLGLDVHHPGAETRQRLRAIVPAAGSVNGPVDTAATVSAEAFRAVLETLGADADVHAVIALVLRTGATGDLLQAVAEAELAVPIAVVVLNQPEAVRLVPTRGGNAPCYAYPEVAARALSRAVTYAQWRAMPRQTVPEFPDVDAEQARGIVHAFLARQPGGGWLPEQDVAGLLRLYRIPLAAAPVRPAAGDGTEVFVGVQDDQMFGPLVVLGLGGIAAGALAGHAARLAPLTEADADALIGSVRSAALLHGQRGDPAAALTALRDVLLRVSRLSDDLPEITELDLNPVIAHPDGAVVAGARARVAAQAPQDPFLRRLR
jgi:acyl-CoA synthetase (NDP forming)